MPELDWLLYGGEDPWFMMLNARIVSTTKLHPSNLCGGKQRLARFLAKAVNGLIAGTVLVEDRNTGTDDVRGLGLQMLSSSIIYMPSANPMSNQYI
jgi:hypothetical protein